MAKDGTNRGGSRAGAGRKSKALADKLTAGNPGGRKLTVVNFDNDTAELKKAVLIYVPRMYTRKHGSG